MISCLCWAQTISNFMVSTMTESWMTRSLPPFTRSKKERRRNRRRFSSSPAGGGRCAPPRLGSRRRYLSTFSLMPSEPDSPFGLERSKQLMRLMTQHQRRQHRAHHPALDDQPERPSGEEGGDRFGLRSSRSSFAASRSSPT